jgi:hypothetical protein
MDSATVEHKRALLAIHQRRIALYQLKIKRLGGREQLSISDLIQLEDDEERELDRELAAGTR